MGIYNAHGLLRAYTKATHGVWRPVYIQYSHNDGKRENIGVLDGWYIVSPYFETDPDSTFWRDYHRKAFDNYAYTQKSSDNRERRELALRDAQEWCRLTYGIEGWGKIPGFGRDWFPAPVVEWAKAMIRKVGNLK